MHEKRAREIAKEHLDRMLEVLDNPDFGTIYECYSPDNAEPAKRVRSTLFTSNG